MIRASRFPATCLLVVVLAAGGLALHFATRTNGRPAGGQLAASASRDPDRGIGRGAGSSADAFYTFQRAYPKASIPAGAYQRGISQADRLRPYQVNPNPWIEVGPIDAENSDFPNPVTGANTSISGRVSAIAVDRSSCSGSVCGTIYVGAAGGGVWKTTDAGRSWTPLLDDEPNLAVGAIVLDPRNPDIVYVGTGDPSHGGGAHHGIGVLQSTDGGQTWTILGQSQFQNRAVTSILIDPRTAGGSNATLYVSTTAAESGGGPTGGGDSSDNPLLPPRGLYESNDGGQSWSLTTAIFSGSTYPVESAVMDPENPDTLWVAFAYEGIFRSQDDGQSWDEATNGLPSSQFSFVKLAVAPSDPNVMYAAYDAKDDGTGPLALYRSTDAGTSWQKLINTPNSCADQCFANLVLSVDPANPAILYAGGTANYGYLFGEDAACKRFSPLPATCNATLMRSTDGGKTWTDIAENGNQAPLHPDDHAIVIDPNNPSVLYAGSDGGIFHSANAGVSWDSLNKGLATIQVNSLSVDTGADVYIGTQDNGSFRWDNNTGTWTHVNGGDGGIAAADPQNQDISYNAKFGSSLWRNEMHGNQARNTDIAAFRGDYFDLGRGNFYEPYAVAPSKPSDIFYGTYRIWRSKLRGGVDGNHNGYTWDSKKDKNDWVPISFDLSCKSAPVNPRATCDSQDNAGSGIAAIAVSPVNPNVVVTATSNGHVWLTTNALAKVKTDASCLNWHYAHYIAKCNFVKGVRWTRIDTGLPNRYPTAVRFGPNSTSVIFVTYSGFDHDTPGQPGHVFASTNQGRSWLNLNGRDPNSSLPDLPFSDVLLNPTNNHLYAAADYGVYISADSGATWQRIDQGLPAAPVFQMQYFPLGDKLLVGTYGRGVWEVIAP